MRPTSLLDKLPDPEEMLLLVHWRGGDARAGDALARHYLQLLRKFFRTRVRPEDIDDIVQQVWVAIGTSVASPTATGVRTSLRAYIFGIARHVLFRHLRARYRTTPTDPVDSSIESLEPSISQAVGQRLQAEKMRQALQSMPVDMHILLELRYFNQLTTAELAGMYEIPEGTIKSRLAHARKQLDLEMKRR